MKKTEKPIHENVFHFCKKGKLEKLKRMVCQGANLFAKDKKSRNLLHIACSNGHLNIVKFLLENYDPGIINKLNTPVEGGCSMLPIHFAAESGNIELLRFLIEKIKLVPYFVSSEGCLMSHACKSGNLKAVKYVHQTNGCTNAIAKMPLVRIFQSSNLEIIKWAYNKIKKNNVNEQHWFGLTPLHYAVGFGNIDIVQWLVEKKTNLDMQCVNDFKRLNAPKPNFIFHEGCTPLHIACNYLRSNIIEYVVERGADVKITDAFGQTPLHLIYHHKNIIPFLISYKNDVIPPSHVLQYITKMLIASGSDVRAKTNKQLGNQTPIDYAQTVKEKLENEFANLKHATLDFKLAIEKLIRDMELRATRHENI